MSNSPQLFLLPLQFVKGIIGSQQDQGVTVLDQEMGLWYQVQPVGNNCFDTHHLEAILIDQVQVLQMLSNELLLGSELDSAVPLQERHVIKHIRVMQSLGQGNGLILFREKDLGGSHLIKNAAMGLGDSFGIDQFPPQVPEIFQKEHHGRSDRLPRRG